MAVFCSSLISCLPVMLLRNFLDDFEMVVVSAIKITVTVFLHYYYYYYCILNYIFKKF